MLQDQTVHLFSTINHDEEWQNFGLIYTLLFEERHDLLIGAQ